MENVNLKRKVTLKRKGDSVDQQPEKKPNKLIWVGILGVVAVVIFFGINQFGNKGGKDLPANVQMPAETLVQQDSEVEPIAAGENEQTATEIENNEVTVHNNVSEESSSSEDVVAQKTNTTNSSNDSKSTVHESSPKNNTSNSGTQSNSVTVAGSIDEKAIKVIRGDFGNGTDRKDALGIEYDAIQAKVNELYRNKND